MCVQGTSLDDLEDLIFRQMAIERAERDTLSMPGLKPGIENKVKIVPVSENHFRNQKGKRYGRRNFNVNSTDVEENPDENFQDENESAWNEDQWYFADQDSTFYGNFNLINKYSAFFKESWIAGATLGGACILL